MRASRVIAAARSWHQGLLEHRSRGGAVLDGFVYLCDELVTTRPGDDFGHDDKSSRGKFFRQH